MTGYILGAYTAAPATLHEDSTAEQQWYGRLRDETLVGGIELAWDGGFHPLGVEHLVTLLDPRWSSVVTLMPGISSGLLRDSSYGLASDVEASRTAALDDVAEAHRQIGVVRAALGAQAIHTVQIQSAPGAHSHVDAFSASLIEILSWDWDGVQVAVEHCDSREGVTPSKGFLPLNEERAAVRAALAQSVGTAVGHTVNWARSVIEGSDSNTAEDHIRELTNAKVLSGLMFSGVAPDDTVFGTAWADCHLPVAGTDIGEEPLSLLTPARVRRAVALAGTKVYLGAKVSAPKTDAIGLLERLDAGIATLRAIDNAVQQ